jgi:hypothetical protein
MHGQNKRIFIEKFELFETKKMGLFQPFPYLNAEKIERRKIW